MNKKAALIATAILFVVTIIPVNRPQEAKPAAETEYVVNEQEAEAEQAENTVCSAIEETKTAENEAPADNGVFTVWTEKAAGGKMYVNTDGIYSRIYAVMGSTKINKYRLNQEVIVTAVTDTGYYKLDSGEYIHGDFLRGNML